MQMRRALLLGSLLLLASQAGQVKMTLRDSLALNLSIAIDSATSRPLTESVPAAGIRRDRATNHNPH